MEYLSYIIIPDKIKIKQYFEDLIDFQKIKNSKFHSFNFFIRDAYNLNEFLKGKIKMYLKYVKNNKLYIILR